MPAIDGARICHERQVEDAPSVLSVPTGFVSTEEVPTAKRAAGMMSRSG